MEQELAKIWAEILSLNRVGIHDNFFELGGHSLRATQVLSRVRNAVGIELPVRALFEGPTVADLARRINAIDQGIEANQPILVKMIIGNGRRRYMMLRAIQIIKNDFG